MSSLNTVNGILSCAHKFFLQTIARCFIQHNFLIYSYSISLFRDTYNFDGYVRYDCSGIESIMTRHNYTSDIPDTVAVA